MSAVEPIAGTEEGALLRGDVLRGMLNMYSPRPQQGQAQNKSWQSKPINIVDPLLPTNNLGRSVTKANKARIRKAFSHGSALLDSIFAKVSNGSLRTCQAKHHACLQQGLADIGDGGSGSLEF